MEKLLEVGHLFVERLFEKKTETIVNDLSFVLRKGEIVGIIGESGCGKSTVALALAGLLPEDFRVAKGEVKYKEVDFLNLSKKLHLEYLKKKIGFIFQDSMMSLNPLIPVGNQITEKLTLSGMKKPLAIKRAIEVMKAVGLADAEIIFKKYPHELSGGMRQRIVIAIAIVNSPQLLIADEPTTALDTTIQAQILQLLKKIRGDYGCSIILISHDFGVISQICDRVAVMYKGEIVEQAEIDVIFKDPRHPYTQGLMSCLPNPYLKGKPLKTVPGMAMSTKNKNGCFFSERCKRSASVCDEKHPSIKRIDHEHYVRCFFDKE